MVWLKRGFIALSILSLLILIGIFATGNDRLAKMAWDITTGAPDLPFNPDDAVAAPDYADAQNWAALPTRDDLADLIPEGYSNTHAQGQSPVDVFFVHPTGFLKGSSWTSPMDTNTSTAENTQWMIANQASPFNGCCNVYAPRYRQASIFAYIRAQQSTTEEVLGFAYTDVERAFNYYLEHYNKGRPFILAGHSQGSHHGITLLRERIDGTELADRLVAAYLIGGFAERKEFAGLHNIELCNSPEQTACVVHWDTYTAASIDDNEPTTILCTNPLTWQVDGPLADKAQHAGALHNSGTYHAQFGGSDAARGIEFTPLGKPLKTILTHNVQGAGSMSAINLTMHSARADLWAAAIT